MTLPLAEEDRITLTRLEEGMWRASDRFDPRFQETYFSDDFFEFGRSGRVYTRIQIVRKEGPPIAAELPLRDLSIRLLSPDVAQVTYNSAVACDGVIEHGRRSSIWSRTATGWVMRFHQGTPYVP